MDIAIETIDPQRAMELLELNVKNRKINRRRVSSFADMMRRGQWRLTHQGISISPTSLIDGQHRLKAIIAAGVSVEIMVCTEKDDDNFKRVDTGRARSAGDVFQIEGIKNAKQIAAGISMYIKITKGKGFNSNSNQVAKLSHIDILERYNEDPEFYQSICNLSFKMFLKVPIYTVGQIFANMVYLIKFKEYSAEKVIDFFNMLFGVVEKHNVHTTTLREVLIKDAMSQKKFTSNLRTKLLIRTWNNYIKNDYRSKLSLSFVRGEKYEYN